MYEYLSELFLIPTNLADGQYQAKNLCENDL